MKQQMTKIRRQVLDFVIEFTEKNGYSPTISEIKKGISNNGSRIVQYCLDRLEEDGYIKRVRKCRPILILKK